MNEKKIFWLITISLIVIISLPFLATQLVHWKIGYYNTGINYMAGHDKTVYLSYMEQARQGHWLFKNLYTSEAQIGLFFSPLWLALGKVAWLFNLPNLVVFHLARIAAGVFFLYLLYRFLGNFFADKIQKIIAYIMVCIASGFGIWFLLYSLIIGKFSVDYIYERMGTDMWIAESNVFLTLLHSSLFILSQIIILGIFWLFLKNLDKLKLKFILFLFFLTLFLGVFHPYDLITMDAVLAVFLLVYSFIKKKIIWPAVGYLFFIGLASIIGVVYFLYTFSLEPALSGWLAQNIIHSPRFLNYMIGYGLVFALFVVGLLPVMRKRHNRYFLFILIWPLTQIVLLYSPVSFQTKLANGLGIPLSIMASLGLFWLIAKIKARPKVSFLLTKNFTKYFLIVLFIFFLIAGNIFVFIFDLAGAMNNKSPFYISGQEEQAMVWLKGQMKDNDVVLTDKETGNVMPAFTGKIVYIGHGHQTIDWDRKLILAADFFQSNLSDAYKYRWLKEAGISYVYFGPLEDAQTVFQSETKNYLELVYKNSKVRIFRVK